MIKSQQAAGAYLDQVQMHQTVKCLQRLVQHDAGGKTRSPVRTGYVHFFRVGGAGGGRASADAIGQIGSGAVANVLHL